MFYVKGKSHLLHLLPTATTAQENEDEQDLTGSIELTADTFSSTIVHYLLSCVDLLPGFLIMASSMTLLAYIYTLLIIPTVFTAVIPAGNGTMFNGTDVPIDIGCPFLTPRETPAQNVRDLRPDDIKFVIGLGDSVMAAFAAKGIQDDTFFTVANLYENRGISFAMGGDPDVITMPNILQYYSNDLLGSSLGDHIISICFGNQVCPKGQYRSKLDVLNAAQSGARSLNLNHEIDYILDQLEEYYDAGEAKPTDWKLVTLFIGSNDLCHSCTQMTSLPPAFSVNALAAVERLRTSMTNVLVQVGNGYDASSSIVIQTSSFTEYCQPIKGSSFVGHDHECECSHSDTNRTIMSDVFPHYNTALQGIAQYYQSVTDEKNSQFGVVFQPLLVDIMTFPIEAISNIDCFHPSALAHAWLSKMFWNMMFMSPDEKSKTLTFNADAPIYCPTDADRFRTL
ncbi:hypothetical protein HPULCUR_006883 [Helicostylum pulchrum]|uniref:Phospholipase B1, membrane-associated n=1 Tax=Helicostylum pulchrum TaxID=562976 RepID=A0ABP9Y378_9FUNG